MMTLTAMTLSLSPKIQSPLKAPDIQQMRLSKPLIGQLYEDLLARHGPILGGADLAKAMGYRSLAAFRQARRRGQVEVDLFTLPNRRGVFALSIDVARWLAHTAQANILTSHASR